MLLVFLSLFVYCTSSTIFIINIFLDIFKHSNICANAKYAFIESCLYKCVASLEVNDWGNLAGKPRELPLGTFLTTTLLKVNLKYFHNRLQNSSLQTTNDPNRSHRFEVVRLSRHLTPASPSRFFDTFACFEG
jgi:hypothetical protein